MVQQTVLESTPKSLSMETSGTQYLQLLSSEAKMERVSRPPSGQLTDSCLKTLGNRGRGKHKAFLQKEAKTEAALPPPVAVHSLLHSLWNYR